ncbi:DNA damage-regulated autophagy modulator protein 1-like isoform X2 [Argiope bruennichi]|uniref:DNA damage-regulated autophagy modulator protein 1-like isoform X2 n=1 Tax=Argiope bruennichi TaxID=94029 RepID=UPI0024957FC5|nr:DNA damage-regulated autophagy modulator protein 1-like isoform X2 [Argiope bruennichi]
MEWPTVPFGFRRYSLEWPKVRFGIRRDILEWPKVEVSYSKAHTEYKFIGGSWLPMLMTLTMLASIFVPYFIVLARGNLSPFLPLISQVSGSPPQSGIFNLFISISSLQAFIGLNLFFMGLRIKEKRLQDEWVRQTASLLNKIALIPGHVGILGMVIVGSYPLDFYRKTEIWMGVTIIPHLSGALSLFLGGIFYCMIMTYIMALMHPEQKRILGVRIFLISLITMCSALMGYSMKDGFSLEEEISTSCSIQPEDVQYNLSYLIAAVCEWALILAFIIFFITMQQEGKDFCFTMCMSLREDEKSTKGEEEIEKVKNDENHNTGTPDKAVAITEEQS